MIHDKTNKWLCIMKKLRSSLQPLAQSDQSLQFNNEDIIADVCILFFLSYLIKFSNGTNGLKKKRSPYLFTSLHPNHKGTDCKAQWISGCVFDLRLRGCDSNCFVSLS